MFNRHRKMIGQVPMVYEWGAVAAAVISAAVSTKQAEEQKKITRSAEAKREAKAESAEEEAARIERETRPEGEELQAIEFGAGDDAEIGNVSEFVRPRTETALGTTTGSGLGGFKI